MRRCLLIAIVRLACAGIARGDGGTVRFSQREGAYQITVFTSPTPFRAGPVDISVFVQDEATGNPVNDVRATVEIAPADRPQGAMTEEATSAAATNKLFRAALFDLPAAGEWQVHVGVVGPPGAADARFQIEAGEPIPHWSVLWPWIAWPAIAIALFCIHQVLVSVNRKRITAGIDRARTA